MNQQSKRERERCVVDRWRDVDVPNSEEREGEMAREAENSFVCVFVFYLFIRNLNWGQGGKEGSLKWKHGAVSLVNPVLLFIFGRRPPLGLPPSMFMSPISIDFFCFLTKSMYFLFRY